MTAAAHILLVEDETQIRRFVRTALQADGYAMLEADTLRQGLSLAATRKPDLVILDLGLPDGNGVDFVQDLRNWSRLPILILSARTAEENKIQALDAGADDYLTKPFAIGELLARVRALLRRSKTTNLDEQPTIQFGDITVDMLNRVVTRAGQQVHLTPIEYRLLCVMLVNAGKVLTQRYLLREVWGPAAAQSSHYLRIYVGHLRQKLEHDPTQPRHLLTETGVGYRLQL